MPLRVIYQSGAENDLQDIFTYIMEQSSSADTASRYTDRIKSFCDSFVTFPHRGTQRDDLYPGIRLIGFERRVTIAFTVTDDTVQIVRIFYAGRDVDLHFHASPEDYDDDI